MTKGRAGPLGIALFLMSAMALAEGCEREPGRELESAPRPLARSMAIAPVADEHIWVMAFLTHVSTTQPAGLDARLEGRTGPQGLRHPEPVIEGESKAALAGALAAYSEQHPRPPELVPVYQPRSSTPPARAHERLYFVDMGEGFTLDGEARAGLQAHDDELSVHLYLGETQRRRFAQLTRAYLGRRVAVIVDDELLMLPRVMSAVPDRELRLVSGAKGSAPALLARLTAG